MPRTKHELAETTVDTPFSGDGGKLTSLHAEHMSGQVPSLANEKRACEPTSQSLPPSIPECRDVSLPPSPSGSGGTLPSPSGSRPSSGGSLPSPSRVIATRGKVYLVGAGPGDPELITVKGLRCLRAADVVVYDRLANPALLDEVSPHAELIFVGKQTGHCSLRQQEINALLIEQARLGRNVVRLKGGDPCVFGRGGEEALDLAEAGIAFEIVPGISSAIAVPAYAGIPVTQRGQSCVLTIVTGHEQPGRASSLVDWDALAKVAGTLVILMGVATLPAICQHLRNGGMSAEMPAAVIEQGTTAQQRQVTGTLADIAERVVAAGLRSPAVVVIGCVVDLSAALSWFATQERVAVAEG